MTRKLILDILGVVFAALLLVSLISAQTPDRYRPVANPIGLSLRGQGRSDDGRSFRHDLRQSIETKAADSDPLLLPVVTYASGAISAGLVALADVNGDGKPDIVVLNYCGGKNADGGCTPGKFGILLGNGDGTFKPVVTYNAGGFFSFAMKVADMNGDGKPDLVAANDCGSDTTCQTRTATVAILLGNGDGTFQSAIVSDAGGFPAQDLAIADFNGDGKLDVVAVNCDASRECWTGTGQAAVLLGNGDGTLQEAVLLPLGGQTPESVATADVNGDGKADVVVVSCAVANENDDPCPYANTYDVLLGNGNGTFQPPITSSSTGYSPRYLALGDVNGDGRPDMLFGVSFGINVLLGNGDGTFQTAMPYDTNQGCTSNSVTISDLDRDGKPDLLVGTQNCSAAHGAVNVMRGNGDGTFQPMVSYDSGGWDPEGTAAGDVNGDGKPDAIVAVLCAVGTNCDAGGLVGVFLNNSPPHSPTTTALVPSADPVGLRKVVTYTATVNSGYAGPVGGTITFRDGSTLLQTVAMVGQQASYATSYNKVGSHFITATYSGDADSAASTSPVLTEYVAGPSTLALTSSGSPSHVGQPVTFTATVVSKYGSPADGELVTFYDGKKVLGSVPTAGGVAAFTVSTFTAKKHTIKAVYPGDTRLLPSHRSIVQVVEP